jgi:membrane associated rhomboid family serine protease
MSSTTQAKRNSASVSGRVATRWEASADGARLILGMLAVMWVAWIVNAVDGYGLDQYGIHPRNVGRLYSILDAPFIHGSFAHIFGNTIPFAILGLVIAGSGVRRVVQVTVISILVSGIGVWLTASGNSETFGASGVVFGFAAYLVARGIFSRRLGELLIGAIVGGVFGLTLLWDLVPKAGVSWQGHLFGAVGGILAASLLTERQRRSSTAPGA